PEQVEGRLAQLLGQFAVLHHGRDALADKLLEQLHYLIDALVEENHACVLALGESVLHQRDRCELAVLGPVEELLAAARLIHESRRQRGQVAGTAPGDAARPGEQTFAAARLARCWRSRAKFATEVGDRTTERGVLDRLLFFQPQPVVVDLEGRQDALPY